MYKCNRVCTFQANGTFEYLATIKQLAIDWHQALPDIENFLENDPRVEALRVSGSTGITVFALVSHPHILSQNFG